MAAQTKVATLTGELHADVPALPPPENGNGVTALIQMAIQKMDGENGPSIVQTLNGLYDLHVKEQTRQAEMAFFAAFAQFKARVKPIYKNETSKKTDGGSGAKFSYRYASLDYIASEVDPILSDVGLSYSWSYEVDDKMMNTICTLRHIGGHSISSSFKCPISSNLPIGDQQKYGAVRKYGERYSLTGVLGLTTTEDDTDAQLGTGRPVEFITTEQANEIAQLLADTKTAEKQWCEHVGVESVMDVPADRFQNLVNQLKRKKANLAGN